MEDVERRGLQRGGGVGGWGGVGWGLKPPQLAPSVVALRVLIKTFTVLSKQKEHGEAPDWITLLPRGPVSWGGLN